MPTGRPLSPAEIEAIRLGYQDLDTLVRVTAARFGITTAAIYKLKREHGWASRLERRVAERRVRAQAGAAGHSPTSLDRLRRLAERSGVGLEASFGSAESFDPERATRALATHARTVAMLHKLEAARPEEPEPDDEPPPRTLAELRDELRRHLERIHDEERDRLLRGDAGPE